MSLMQAEPSVKATNHHPDRTLRSGRKPERFTQIGNSLDDDKRLSPRDQQILRVLWSYSFNGQTCHPKNQTIADRVRCSPEWVSKTISRLKRFGYIATTYKPHFKNPKVMVRHIEFLIPIGPTSKKMLKAGETGPARAKSPTDTIEQGRRSPDLSPEEATASPTIEDAGMATGQGEPFDLDEDDKQLTAEDDLPFDVDEDDEQVPAEDDLPFDLDDDEHDFEDDGAPPRVTIAENSPAVAMPNREPSEPRAEAIPIQDQPTVPGDEVQSPSRHVTSPAGLWEKTAEPGLRAARIGGWYMARAANDHPDGPTVVAIEAAVAQDPIRIEQLRAAKKHADHEAALPESTTPPSTKVEATRAEQEPTGQGYTRRENANDRPGPSPETIEAFRGGGLTTGDFSRDCTIRQQLDSGGVGREQGIRDMIRLKATIKKLSWRDADPVFIE